MSVLSLKCASEVAITFEVMTLQWNGSVHMILLLLLLLLMDYFNFVLLQPVKPYR